METIFDASGGYSETSPVPSEHWVVPRTVSVVTLAPSPFRHGCRDHAGEASTVHAAVVEDVHGLRLQGLHDEVTVGRALLVVVGHNTEEVVPPLAASDGRVADGLTVAICAAENSGSAAAVARRRTRGRQRRRRWSR